MALILITWVAQWATPARSVVLVRDGRAECTIVAPREEQCIVDAARDLQYHLCKMSGAEVPIVHDPSEVNARSGVGIYIDTKPLNVHVPGRLVDRSRTGFQSGPYGLCIAPGMTGEIIYDMRLAKGLRFKDVCLPGGPGGVDLAIKLALPKGGHNGIEVSLDRGRTWIIAFKDVRTLGTRGDVVKYDLTKHVRGSSRFLLKFWVKNSMDREVLAIDCQRRNIEKRRVELNIQSGDLPQRQAQWLRKDLERNDDKKFIFVFTHHPQLMGGADAQPYTSIYNENKVSATFSGHAHIYNHEFRNGVHYFQSGGGSDTAWTRGEQVITKRQEGAKGTFVFRRYGPQ